MDLITIERRLTASGGPFELKDIGGVGPAEFVGGPCHLGDVYARAKRFGSARLLVHAGITYGYHEIFENSSRLAAALAGMNMAKVPIGLAVRDPARWIQAFVAITSIGGTAVLFQPNLGVSDVAHVPRARILRDEDVDDLLRSIDATSGIVPVDQRHARDDALIAFTSGSTGAAKGVVHTHGSIVAALRSMMLVGAVAAYMDPDRRAPAGARRAPPATVVLTPLSYVAGYSAILLAMMTGGAMVVPKDGDPASVAHAVHDAGAQSVLGLSTDAFRGLARLPDAATLLASLTRLQLHGGRISDALRAEIGAVLPDVQIMAGYGLSETGGTLASAPLRRDVGPAEATGRLSPAVDVRIVDADGHPVADGTTGRLEVRGPMLMRGYIDENATARAVTPGGWFRTGDIARLHPDRWIEVVDRSDAQGGLFGLDRIERAACTFPGVDDACAAVSTDGGVLVTVQIIGAAVNEAALTDALIEVVGAGRPVRVRSLAQLPRTPTGKIDRALLRDAAG